MTNSTQLSLDERLIITGLTASDAEAVIRALAGRLEAAGFVKSSWADAVLAREKVYATGLPTEVPVGLPHTDVEHCLKPAIAVATLARPVTFGMMGDPTQTVNVQTVFALSVVQPQEQVQTLTQLIDFCQKPENLRELQAAPNAERAVELLRARLGLASAETGSGGEPEPPTAEAASIIIHVGHPVGLHARPAAKFVQMAARFQSKIEVANLTKASGFVNAKSVLKVLTLAVQQGNDVSLRADGPDAETALSALRELVEGNFGETEDAG